MAVFVRNLCINKWLAAIDLICCKLRSGLFGTPSNPLFCIVFFSIWPVVFWSRGSFIQLQTCSSDLSTSAQSQRSVPSCPITSFQDLKRPLVSSPVVTCSTHWVQALLDVGLPSSAFAWRGKPEVDESWLENFSFYSLDGLPRVGWGIDRGESCGLLCPFHNVCTRLPSWNACLPCKHGWYIMLSSVPPIVTVLDHFACATTGYHGRSPAHRVLDWMLAVCTPFSVLPILAELLAWDATHISDVLTSFFGQFMHDT